MKKISWEIVVAGIVFIIAAAFMLNDNNEEKNYDQASGVAFAVSEEGNGSVEKDVVRQDQQGALIIDLKNLEELKKLESLKDLEKLKELEHLKKLEKLEKIFPKETWSEVESGINEALAELETELETATEDISEETWLSLETTIHEALKEARDELAKENIQVSLVNNNLVIKSDYKIEEGAWSNVSPGAYAFTKKFDISNIDKADLRMDFGHITIIGTDATEGSLTIEASGDIASVEDISQKLRTKLDISSTSAIIKIGQNDNISNDDYNSIQLEAILTVPTNSTVITGTDGGHIRIENVNGSQDIATTAGHIELSNTSGSITARTEGGNIIGKNINGDLQVTTDGGHIRLTNVKGPLNAQSGGGNMELKLFDVSSPINAKTSAGNIILYVPKSVQANLKASGSSIVIDKKLKLSGDRAKSFINGRLGKGGKTLDISTGQGNVHVKSNG